jgi:SAM-dependent methyltransferase
MSREGNAAMMDEASYLARVAMENEVYAFDTNVHHLPEIHHYWSNKYLLPKLESFGLSDEKHLFEKYLLDRCAAGAGQMQRFASIGAGNCDLEIELALRLEAKGYRQFTIDCIDLNPSMLQRGSLAAVEQNVGDRIRTIEADFNDWVPSCQYDAVMANQSLHHVLRLEHLFDQIKGCLKTDGCFIVSDIIGRNGHQRWPEALQILEEFWRKLPPSYRFNQRLLRYEEKFKDWDCSTSSFEAIRSEDILRLLIDRFHFHFFFAFANVIEPFVDRHFGHHFDAVTDWDRVFIDEVVRRDEAEIRSGRIKPTHMMAVLRNERAQDLIHEAPLTPEFCLRVESVKDAAGPSQQNAYQWDAWPHSAQTELENACRMLKDAEDRIYNLSGDLARSADLIERFGAEVDRLNQKLKENGVWALGLNKEVAELQSLVDERTAWAQKLDREMQERTRWALTLDEELQRLNWARRVMRGWYKLRDAVGALWTRRA